MPDDSSAEPFAASKRELTIWWVVYLLAAVLIVLNRSRSPDLLLDSDTVGILAGIREHPSPWYWFVHDWPLGNHFYRPVSSLTFWLDGADSPVGRFALTNAVLVALSTLGLGWLSTLASRLWRSRWLLAAPLIFTYWCLFGIGWAPAVILIPMIGLSAWVGAWRRVAVLAVLAPLFVTELSGLMPLYTRNIGWIPGRTATTMAVFAIPALASVLAYRQRAHWSWLAVGGVCTLLALGSYEQAVMILPAAALLWWGSGGRLRDAWPLLSVLGAALVIYFVVRINVVPMESSGYQRQQWKTGSGALFSLAEFTLPASATGFLSLAVIRDLGFWILMFWMFLPTYAIYLHWVGYAIIARLAWRKPEGRRLVGLWLASALAYAPMAFFHQFDHYFFWPMALRALAVLELLRLVWAYDGGDDHRIRSLFARGGRAAQPEVL